MNIAYIRVSTDTQTTENQRNELLRYAHSNKLMIDEFMDIEISSRKSIELRKLNELFSKISDGDNVLVTELSRLGRSTIEVLTIVKTLVEEKGAVLHVVKQGLKLDKHNKNDMVSKTMITMFGLFAELERDLISTSTVASTKCSHYNNHHNSINTVHSALTSSIVL
jgi:DNA invertase Pin-like site-specific DNA recombinase